MERPAKSGTSTDVPTKDRLIIAARDLFWSRGYEATSLAEIVKKAEVNSGSLYYFFKTKEELLLAVLDWYMENLFPQLIEPIIAHISDPIERVFALLDGYRKALVATGCTYGCPIGNLTLELGDSLPRAREKLAKNFEDWRQWVRKFLEEAGPRLPEKLDRNEVATFVLTVMEGGVMQSRAQQSLEPFDAGVRQLRTYFYLLTGEHPSSVQ
ncbi:MAG: transcriptional regulator, TetR family [Candidatus Angelobacter sp.]|nr:transcriptional regulator, TetR family [Candidatus Angelobacter sp.]